MATPYQRGNEQPPFVKECRDCGSSKQVRDQYKCNHCGRFLCKICHLKYKHQPKKGWCHNCNQGKEPVIVKKILENKPLSVSQIKSQDNPISLIAPNNDPTSLPSLLHGIQPRNIFHEGGTAPSFIQRALPLPSATSINPGSIRHGQILSETKLPSNLDVHSNSRC